MSGYLHPRPSAEIGETVSGESHAWVEWFCGGEWRGYDPTNRIDIGDRHVSVGRGRDYNDVPPLRGVRGTVRLYPVRDGRDHQGVGSAMSMIDEVAHERERARRPARAGRLGPQARHGMETLQFDYVEFAPGRAVFEGLPGDHAYNPIGVVQGGYAAAILDAAMGCAVHTRLSESQAYTTLEFKVSFLSPILRDTGVVRATGTALKVGRRAGFAEGILTDSAGKALVSATSTLLVFDR